ncbi:hypothetical protein GQ54DRAFT_150082 [Martensiomyces pterosporus]|nr:hypothetical protein GQ54DRAFT_150082 [Martensiomyces pterosporus]
MHFAPSEEKAGMEGTTLIRHDLETSNRAAAGDIHAIRRKRQRDSATDAWMELGPLFFLCLSAWVDVSLRLASWEKAREVQRHRVMVAMAKPPSCVRCSTFRNGHRRRKVCDKAGERQPVGDIKASLDFLDCWHWIITTITTITTTIISSINPTHAGLLFYYKDLQVKRQSKQGPWLISPITSASSVKSSPEHHTFFHQPHSFSLTENATSSSPPPQARSR